MGRLYSNNYSTTISTASVGTGDTTFNVTSIVGLPLIGGGDWAILTITDSLTSPTKTEIVKATAVSTNTLTVERAQEGTTAQAWTSSDFIELRATAESFATLDGTVVKRYSETLNGSAGTTIDRADGGIQTVTLAANGTYTPTMEDGESMLVRFINTDTYIPSFSGCEKLAGIDPTFLGATSLVSFVKIGGTVYMTPVGDFN